MASTTMRGVSPRRGSGQGGGSRERSLSEERIAATALELADREGIEAVSIRRLAGELGVGAMTLYGYFPDKDALLEAVLDHATRDPELPAAGGPWRGRLRDLMLGVRRALLRHPSGVEIRLRRPILTLGALRVTEAGMQILGESGLARGEAARAYRTLFLYVFGFAAFSPRDGGTQVRDRAAATLAGLDPATYPALTSAVAEAADTMTGDEEQFLWGLERLLDGIEAAAARARP